MNEEKLLRLISLGFAGVICGFMIYSLGNFVIVQNIPLFSVTSPLVFAFLVSIVLLICLVINIIRETRIMQDIKTKDAASQKRDFYELLKVLMAVFILFAYVYLLRIFGFRPVTIGYLFVTMLLLNQLSESKAKKMIKAGLAAVVTVPVLYYIFNGIFLVMLP